MVEEILPFSSISNNIFTKDDILHKAASIEQLSSHPAAQVLVRKAEERKLGILPIPANFHEVAGAGVEGDIDGEHIIIGSQSLIERKKQQQQQQQNQPLLPRIYEKYH